MTGSGTINMQAAALSQATVSQPTTGSAILTWQPPALNTDGSALTEMGLPTANVFTGGHDAHSEREWICIEDMGLAAATLVELARVWAER